MRTPRTHTIQSACEHDVTVPWAAVTPARYAEVKSCVETRDNGRVGTFKIWRDNHDALVTAPDRDPAAVPVYEFIVTRPTTTPSSATIDVDTATEVIARITVHARLVDTFLDQHEAWRATPRPTQSAFAVVSWRELFSFFDIWEDTTPTVIASDNMFGRRYEVDTGIEIYDDDVYADPEAHDLVREARRRHAWHQLVTRRDRVTPTLSYT